MKSHLRASIQPGLESLRSLWKPFFAIQLLGLLLVLAYFYWPPVTAILDRIALVKSHMGLMFAALTMPIASGILPEVFKSMTGVARGWDRSRVTGTIHAAILFGIMGVMVELFYIWLNGTFGVSKTMGTVFIKMAIDQGLYSVFISVPLIAFSYTLRRHGYRLLASLREIDWKWCIEEVLPILVVSWCYWTPMCLLMYTLPPRITFIFGMIGSAACATLLTAVAGRARPDSELN